MLQEQFQMTQSQQKHSEKTATLALHRDKSSKHKNAKIKNIESGLINSAKASTYHTVW